jgi:hypothetical protein
MHGGTYVFWIDAVRTARCPYVLTILCLRQDPYCLLPATRKRCDMAVEDGAQWSQCDELPISRAMVCPDTYLVLRDSILGLIRVSTAPELEPARDLLYRYDANRDKFKCVGTVVLNCQESSVDFETWEKSDESIVEEILELGRLDNDGHLYSVSSDDLIVHKFDLHHGSKSKDPLTKMRFLEKHQLNQIAINDYHLLPVASIVDPLEYMSRLPKALREYNLRVYCKDSDDNTVRWLGAAFQKWCDNRHPQFSRYLPITQEDLSQENSD